MGDTQCIAWNAQKNCKKGRSCRKQHRCWGCGSPDHHLIYCQKILEDCDR